MLKLQRPTNTPSKQRERFHFKFSNFQALQVPKGWDRLFVSVVSAETGKTIAKLGKALVKNGSCQWTETISESIYISRHDSPKGYEECLVKLVVSTGSTRSNNTLGEASINMAQHASSRASAAVSLPLKKCSYGSILQVRIQRVTPRSRTGDEESKSLDSQEKAEDDAESKSHRSDNSRDSAGRPPREDLATSSRPLKLDSEEASESASGMNNSFYSLDGSHGRGSSSAQNVFKSEEYNSEIRVGGSNNGDLQPDHFSVDDEGSPSNQSPEDSREYSRETVRNEAAVSRWSVANSGSSRNLLEAAEQTIEELRAEAKMWERNARKLMIDLDISRKEFSDLSKKQAELGMELSAAYAEQDGLRREVERVKVELQELAANRTTRGDPMVQSLRLQKELENEIKYQQNLNDDFSQQLKQSQESNIELVSVLGELEETIEQQRIEIEDLSSLKFNFMDLQNSLSKSSEENRTLLLQLESEKNLKEDIELINEALRNKTDELEKERKSSREEISSLKEKLSGSIKDEELNVKAENDEILIREIESLREKVKELEKDCTELTDENLELLFKLKDSNKTNIRKCSSFDSMTSEHPASCPSDGSEVSDPKYQVSNLEEEQLKPEVSKERQIAGFESSVHFAEVLEQIDIAFQLLMKPWYGRSSREIENEGDDPLVNAAEMSVEYIRSLFKELNKLLEMRKAECDEILRNHEIEINDRNAMISDARKKIEESFLEVQELENFKAISEENYANIMRELEHKRSEVVHMEAELLSRKQEINFHSQRLQELEAEVTELQQKTIHLEQDLEVALRERRVSSECLETLQSELTALSDAVISHVSANANLERNVEDLQIRRHDLENSLSGLHADNTRLHQCISDLEVQVQQLEDEKRLCLQEIENYKSSSMSLRDEMDIQIFDLKQNSEDIRKEWLRAQEECGHLKEENKALQASGASSVLETAELENLKRENQELHEKCSEMVDQLTEMTKALADCNKKVESLQSHLTSVQDDFVLRESHLQSDLEALVKENSCQKEKLSEEESLRELLLEKTTEFERLQKEMECLSEQLNDAHREMERISLDSSNEVSSLLADKAELQASLHEVRCKAESTTKKLDAALQEYELKVEGLTDQLAASSHSHERLVTEHERTLKLLANYRKVEEKLKTDLNELELKHTISDYERQQLSKEMSVLKVQLQSISDLQNEVSILKSELKDCKLDKGKLELALLTVSGDYEQLKAESISLSEKISIFEGAMSEFEECNRKKLHLEEKLLQMEKDLSATEILCIQNADLKNELNEIKRVSMQYQQKMYRLEEEKDEWLKKAQALEENLKLKEERNNIHKEGAQIHDFHDQDVASGDNLTKRQLLEDESSEGLDANNKNRFLHESSGTPSSQKRYSGMVARERYERTKSSLETELRDLKERYLEMSLKYAEVEEQREDLVMKLKATRSGKRWLSLS